MDRDARGLSAERPRLAVLISGRGSNMAALLEAGGRPGWPGRVALVVADRAGAAGLALAAGRGVATAIVPSAGRPREAFEAELDALLAAHGVDAIALAGFMRVLTQGFVSRWEGRMVNIHPSLLPKYRGLDTHGRALAAGDREAGCTVHLVTAALDDGPVVAQTAVPVLPGDTPETLAARVLAQEHRLYPRAVARWLATLPLADKAGPA